MKKDRNCMAVPYPIYPPYQPMNQGVMPINNQMPNMMGMNMQPYPNFQTGSMDQLSNLNNQISSLEKRVSNLENLIGNKYNPTNFQVM